MPNIQQLAVNNTFTESLPADTIPGNALRTVHAACYSYVTPEQPPAPRVIHYSDVMVNELGIEDPQSDEFLKLMSGQSSFQNSKPYAMCYGGHQFGHWAGQLGDGRAINLAEVEHQDKRWALQLKGAGPTPYSRRADGYAVLRSSVREYLCSGAMHHLGIPTTRALSLVSSGKKVMRDILYDGHPEFENGAIVCRVSPSFIRFGNFELFNSRNDLDSLRVLADYTINQFYSHLGIPSQDVYLEFFREVCERTLDMIIHWQRVGFVHGVMNTDNMSILGLTIDYGPYGWLEPFEPDWTPNITDSRHRRYRYGNQPGISLWNLSQLAKSLYPLAPDADAFNGLLEEYQPAYEKQYSIMMLSRLGLLSTDDDATDCIESLEQLLEKSRVDMTLFFRQLSLLDIESPDKHLEVIQSASYLPEDEFLKTVGDWKHWLGVYAARIKKQNRPHDERVLQMHAMNPKYVLRNYMAQQAIDAADEGDYQLINELYELLKRPYDEQPEMQKWFSKRPDWAENRAGCSMLSCSS